MTAWITLDTGKVHWVVAEMPYSVVTACHWGILREHIASTEFDGCPVDNPQLCRDCREAWRR